MSIEIRVLREGDDAVLGQVAPEVFDNPVDARLTAEFLADPRHHIVVALDGELVVGFASAVHYLHPDKHPELWINEVAVAPGWRRRGLAKAILKRLLQVGSELKCTEAWVLTDRANGAARVLYSSAGGTEGVGGSGGDNPIIGYSFPLEPQR